MNSTPSVDVLGCKKALQNNLNENMITHQHVDLDKQQHPAQSKSQHEALKDDMVSTHHASPSPPNTEQRALPTNQQQQQNIKSQEELQYGDDTKADNGRINNSSDVKHSVEQHINDTQHYDDNVYKSTSQNDKNRNTHKNNNNNNNNNTHHHNNNNTTTTTATPLQKQKRLIVVKQQEQIDDHIDWEYIQKRFGDWQEVHEVYKDLVLRYGKLLRGDSDVVLDEGVTMNLYEIVDAVATTGETQQICFLYHPVRTWHSHHVRIDATPPQTGVTPQMCSLVVNKATAQHVLSFGMILGYKHAVCPTSVEDVARELNIVKTCLRGIYQELEIIAKQIGLIDHHSETTTTTTNVDNSGQVMVIKDEDTSSSITTVDNISLSSSPPPTTTTDDTNVMTDLL